MSRFIEINELPPVPACSLCANHITGIKCKAFDEIPDSILLGENDHTKPLKDQENDIVFEPIE